jgi:hypothetical protein
MQEGKVGRIQSWAEGKRVHPALRFLKEGKLFSQGTT